MRSWAVSVLLLICFCHMFVGGQTESSPSPTNRPSSEAGTSSLNTSDSGTTTHGENIDSQPESPTSSGFPSAASSTTKSDNLGVASDSTAHSATEAPTTGPSLSLKDNPRNGSATNGAPLGDFSTAKNLVLVLLLIVAMMVLISLIVLRFKCRNYRKHKREAKDSTSDQTTADKDQVTLISIKSTDTDAGEPSFGKHDAVENGKVEDLAQAQIHNQQRPSLN
ncbi:uncharacterized protein LOC121280417 isoform X2 [Carcharodon carcharias]|uniref:uncharacterized protein LOC121280417 isoform X2 n=1 Tax=Carcharodon carcharias TaxID=13397 RepID=UPI001B7E2380|nr:uncharacterized protein LOC121280417 isoform X2 [Carcharodon carcharias]